MLLKILAVGKLKDRAVQARCDEYARRIGAYGKLEVCLLPDSTVAGEGAAFARALDRERGAAVIALSEEGREYTSMEFARKLGALDRKAVFLIGGPFGLAPEIRHRADELWSLSRLTFPHEIARLLLYEQLFRALNILHGGGYHNP